MTTLSSAPEMKSHRIVARLRRIQGQVAAIERSLAMDPNYGTLLQRVAAARGAMTGLMADLIEDQLRAIPLAEGVETNRETIEKTIDIVHAYLD